MGTTTGIDWCDHTFNPWRGSGGVLAMAYEAYWRLPSQWDATAVACGNRRRVFCGSLMDVFEDRSELIEPRARLFNLICKCNQLDWLLLTKRIENAGLFIGGTSGMGFSTLGREYQHLWLGTSVENQGAADQRIPELVKIPAAVRFLSVEPLLEKTVLRRWHCTECDSWVPGGNLAWGHPCGTTDLRGKSFDACESYRDLGIDWVIIGCESGPNRRPFDNQWAHDIADQCNAAGVPVFVKQLRDENDNVVHGPHEWDGWPAWASQDFPTAKNAGSESSAGGEGE